MTLRIFPAMSSPSIVSSAMVGAKPFLALLPTAGAALPISFLLMSSILPIIKVLLIAATGLLFAQPQVGVLNGPSRHSLSKLVFTIFLPAIIFVNLGEAITPTKLLEWWFIPVNVIIASVIGCLIGTVVAKATDVPPEFFRVTFILTGIGNMGNMPLVLLSAVCSDSRNPFGDQKSCSQIGTAYISLGMWTAALIMWLFAYNILAPPEQWLPGFTRKTGPGSDEISSIAVQAVPEVSGSDNASLTAPLTGADKTEASPSVVFMSELESNFKFWMKLLHIYDILRPPVLAAFLAMILGMVPFLDHAFFSPDGTFRFLTDAIAILGAAMIPCILLVLGGNLVGGPATSELPPLTTFVIVLTRLLVIPCVGLVVVLTADYLGFLPANDPMFRFVLFLQHTMPSSIQIGTACSLQGFGEKEVSAVLFYQHVAAVVTMAIFLFVYFFILFGA